MMIQRAFLPQAADLGTICMKIVLRVKPAVERFRNEDKLQFPAAQAVSILLPTWHNEEVLHQRV